MTIKNVSGVRRTFSFGTGRDAFATSLDNNGTVTVPDRPQLLADILAQVEAGELELTSPPAQVLNSVALPKTVRALVTAAAVAGTIVVGGETLTIAGANAAALATSLADLINANETLKAAGVYAAARIAVASDVAVYIEVASDEDISPVGDFIALGTATGVTFSVERAAQVEASAVQMAVVSKAATGVTLDISTGLRTVSSYLITVVTAAGALKPITSLVVSDGDGVIGIRENTDSGAVNLAATDVVTVTAFGTRQA